MLGASAWHRSSPGVPVGGAPIDAPMIFPFDFGVRSAFPAPARDLHLDFVRHLSAVLRSPQRGAASGSRRRSLRVLCRPHEDADLAFGLPCYLIGLGMNRC